MIENMGKTNKKILESKKIIKEEKEKIRIEKRNIRRKKYEKISNSKICKFFSKVGNLFKMDKDNYSFSEVFVITLASLVIGAFACFSVFTVFTGGRNYFKLSKELGKFFEVYETIVDNYYDDIDKETLVESAINGMVSSVGDEYTSYVDISGTEEFNELVNGVYEGIGATIQLTDSGIKVIDVYENSPSYKVGLKKDDIILMVDDINLKIDEVGIENISVNELSNYIKVEGSGEVKMVVKRGEEELSFTLKRDKVEMPVVSSTTYEKNGKKIGYIGISIFSSVASKQFESKLEELEKENISGLVIDVRGNNGGYLTTVTSILNLLLPKGEILYQVQKGDDTDVTKDKTATYREYPISVLVNGGSASASEILAAAIKESYNGFVVGTKTYGKGTVQQVKTLSDGSMIKYTIENWLTPEGNWINEKGIEPTDVVELNEEYYENPIIENDNQLQKALELVSK
ncbi:MAG: S41 family peptidase [Bacilli bacterium]|nr:S41 family peptidase [Bacilli bacterium]